MDTSGITKNNNLFWLGRYTERVYQGVVNVRTVQDSILDNEPINIADFRRRVGVTSTKFRSPEDFCERYAFDRSVPESLLASGDAMLGNGMVLREIIGTQTLSYIEMALSALEAASKSQSSDVQLQWVLDDIMAFRGSFAEYIEESGVRNTIRSGASVERIGSYIRLELDDTLLVKEIKKLKNRLDRSHLDYDPKRLAYIENFLSDKEAYPNRFELLDNVESLFRI